MTPRSVPAALIIALAGFATLSCGDATVKSMAGQWPASGVSALRYSFGALGLALVVAARHGRAGFVLPRPWLQAGRGAAVALSTLCFFIGVMAMPLASATAIQFTSPIMTALLSPFVLKEKPPRTVWAATLLAFIGVLAVLRPNLLALGPVALYPVGGAFGMSWLMMLNRKTAGDAPVLAMQFLLAAFAAPLLVLAAALLHLTGAPHFVLPMPSGIVVAKCLVVALFATTGHSLIYIAVLRATAATVAPMTYVQLLMAALLGWLWFGNRPDAPTLAGAALIVAGGLLLWSAQKTPPVAETPD
ncbi:MAG TPA: DMT family transporter [Allosphingosinicella sp.]|nr:DMT family transporter [Allosphingosinicella sp.]